MTRAHSFQLSFSQETVYEMPPHPVQKLTRYLRCRHGDLTKREERSTAYMEVDSLEFSRLFSVITDPVLTEAILKCRDFLHTG